MGNTETLKCQRKNGLAIFQSGKLHHHDHQQSWNCAHKQASAMGVALRIIDHLINFIIDTPFNGGKKLIL